jgi:hypothetical protein
MFQLGKPSSQKTYSEKIFLQFVGLWALVALMGMRCSFERGGNKDLRRNLSQGKTILQIAAIEAQVKYARTQ